MELATTFIRSGIKILVIQEHRIVHQEELKTQKFKDGVNIITSSAWRNSTGEYTGGVGVMVTKEAYAAITFLRSYSNRILTVSFDGNPRLTIITVYSPTEAATDDDAENFHNDLRLAIADVPSHHLLLLIGDLNARMSRVTRDDPC
mgnify:CR=1 FL=1